MRTLKTLFCDSAQAFSLLGNLFKTGVALGCFESLFFCCSQLRGHPHRRHSWLYGILNILRRGTTWVVPGLKALCKICSWLQDTLQNLVNHFPMGRSNLRGAPDKLATSVQHSAQPSPRVPHGAFAYLGRSAQPCTGYSMASTCSEHLVPGLRTGCSMLGNTLHKFFLPSGRYGCSAPGFHAGWSRLKNM